MNLLLLRVSPFSVLFSSGFRLDFNRLRDRVLKMLLIIFNVNADFFFGSKQFGFCRCSLLEFNESWKTQYCGLYSRNLTANLARNSLNILIYLRIFSLVQLMILVDDAGGAFPSVNHSPWFGLTLADFVMPFFLFGVGVSIGLAFKVLLLLCFSLGSHICRKY